MMIGFCALAPASDALVKILGDTIPLLQVLIARFIAQLLLLRGNLWTSRHNTWMCRDRIGLVILRSILHLVAIACLFLSLRYLPLADAIAIAYVLPFLVLGVGWFTGDRASPLTLALCLLGFFGTLMVVQPSFAEVRLASTSACFSSRLIYWLHVYHPQSVQIHRPRRPPSRQWHLRHGYSLTHCLFWMGYECPDGYYDPGE